MCTLIFLNSTTVQNKCYPLLSYSVTPFTAEGAQVWNNKEPLTLASREQSLEIVYQIRPAWFTPRVMPRKMDGKKKKDGQLEKIQEMVLMAHWSCQMGSSVVISHVRCVYTGKHLVTVKCGFCYLDACFLFSFLQHELQSKHFQTFSSHIAG